MTPQVDELEGLLTQHGKSFEFHRYDDTGWCLDALVTIGGETLRMDSG